MPIKSKPVKASKTSKKLEKKELNTVSMLRRSPFGK